MYLRKGPHRLKGYDYASEGAYFITICTHDREHFFGEVRDGQMMLSEMGSIIREEWQKTPEIRKSIYLVLDAFCVMHSMPGPTTFTPYCSLAILNYLLTTVGSHIPMLPRQYLVVRIPKRSALLCAGLREVARIEFIGRALQISDGNPGFTITSFGIIIRFCGSDNISWIILVAGRKICFTIIDYRYSRSP